MLLANARAAGCSKNPTSSGAYADVLGQLDAGRMPQEVLVRMSATDEIYCRGLPTGCTIRKRGRVVGLGALLLYESP